MLANRGMEYYLLCWTECLYEARGICPHAGGGPCPAMSQIPACATVQTVLRWTLVCFDWLADARSRWRPLIRLSLARQRALIEAPAFCFFRFVRKQPHRRSKHGVGRADHSGQPWLSITSRLHALSSTARRMRAQI